MCDCDCTWPFDPFKKKIFFLTRYYQSSVDNSVNWAECGANLIIFIFSWHKLKIVSVFSTWKRNFLSFLLLFMGDVRQRWCHSNVNINSNTPTMHFTMINTRVSVSNVWNHVATCILPAINYSILIKCVREIGSVAEKCVLFNSSCRFFTWQDFAGHPLRPLVMTVRAHSLGNVSVLHSKRHKHSTK